MVASILPDIRREKNRRSRSLKSWVSEARISLTILLLAGGMTVFGWSNRFRLNIDPAQGYGYALGIIGTTMMCALLIYPLRKYSRIALPGSVGFWFRIHMLLGLFGPLAILYHCQFRYEAVNSGVALFLMLTMVCSGLVGRYLHSHIYRGYSLRRLQLSELFGNIIKWRAILDADGDSGDDVRNWLAKYEALVSRSRKSFLESAFIVMRLNLGAPWRRYFVSRQIRRHFAEISERVGWTDAELKQHQNDAHIHAREFLKATRDAGGFLFYDRLFQFWRMLHLPLFGLLAMAVTFHVFAVHMY